MEQVKTRGFTLVELLAVIVILAVLALIAIPIVTSTIDNSEETINKRSVDQYGKAIEAGVKNYLLINGVNPTELQDIEIKYTGNDVNCNITKIYQDGSIYLSECIVEDMEVKDEGTNDGWYHYGEPETFEKYEIGDKVTYNSIDFYVMSEDSKENDSVTLLKADLLTRSEVEEAGKGRINNYIHNLKPAKGSHGGVYWYDDATCNSSTTSGCKNDYNTSDIKYVVDMWSKINISSSDTKIDNLGYKSRLITKEEYQKLYEYYSCSGVVCDDYWFNGSDKVLGTVFYWTMSASDIENEVYGVYAEDGLYLPNWGWAVNYIEEDMSENNYIYYFGVRPVVTLYKSSLQKAETVEEN